MSEILTCYGLTKNYGGVAALRNINIRLESGKIYGLLGPNGSGKTTLIKLINGLLTPTAGSVTIFGNKPGVVTKGLISYLPDNSYLNSWMRVEQIVEQFRDFYPDFREDAAYRMLEGLGIDRKAKLKNLSKGNKEKVCLILVMSRAAKLYVLDEPIAGVDPATRDYIISTIINNYDPDATVLISTHLISDIEQVLDEVIFIQNGEVTLQKGVDEIREENGKSVDELFREVFKW
ncbi:MAG: ABC transporter ATP-binding protein [Clostridia bacterium]|nr:ABC transporter ATP-binding protein [Clostridia bacterium]